MADLALEQEVEDVSAEPDPAYTEVTGDRGVPALDGRCHVQPEKPLPGLSTATAQAFAAVDSADMSLKLYALISDADVPFRANAISNARELSDDLVVKPVQWGSTDWPPTSRRETILLLRRPPGEPLMASLDAKIRPMNIQEIANVLMKPMATLLTAMGDQRMAHRNIRPTNLFYSGGERPVVAGENYSAPPGFNQPSMFEPIERAMCPPAGRGSGDIADDLFALGVTALFLAIGKNPVAHLDERTLLARRVEMGSYFALTVDHKPPGDLAQVIRSLMHDDPNDRWTLEDLSRWVDLGVIVQARPDTSARADRGFEFADGRYHTRRELALAFSQNWAAARDVVQTEEVERWAERSIKDRELALQIAACRHSGGNEPRMVSDDLLLARTLTTLDPEGPLRYRDLIVMPDGVGTLAVQAASDEGLATTFSELISSRLTEFWFDQQTRQSHWAAVGKSDAIRMGGYLEKSGPGFAIERCAYELNKGMACQSPRLKDVNAIQARDVLEALDAGAKRGEQQLDRHVAAFLGARYSGSVDAELIEFANARSGEDALLAQLKLFAAVQLKHGPRELPNLAAVFFDHLDTLMSSFHNVALRERMQRAAERVAASGKLPELLGIVRNRNYLNVDKKGFNQARRKYSSLEREVHAQVESRDHLGRRSLLRGHMAAAYLATSICAAVVVAVVLGGAS